MSLTGKNKISHRARAIEKLRIFLDGYYSPQKK
jgi:inosine/xanthosine triphosphate pyrophosphatase family protein